MSTDTHLEIISVERIDGTEIVIEFSDGTYAVLTTAEVVACAKERRTTPPRLNGEDDEQTE